MSYCDLIGRLLIEECRSCILKKQNLFGVVLNCEKFSSLAQKCELQGTSHLYIGAKLNRLYMSCFPHLAQNRVKQLNFCEQN